MIHITSEEDIKEYYASPALGQSKAKKLLGDISNFNRVEDSNAEHFVIGSAVDCILTGNEGDYDRKYHVSELTNTPSDAVIAIIKTVYEMVLTDYAEYISVVNPVQFINGEIVVEQSSIDNETIKISTLSEFAPSLSVYDTYILDACINADYQKTYGSEAKVAAIIKGGSKDKNVKAGDLYFQDLCKALGKTVLSSDQHNLIQDIVTSLKTNNRTFRYFDKESYQDLANVDVYYQLPIYFTYRGITCKALLDFVFVVKDNQNKILTVQGVDLKTMAGNTWYFSSSLRERRYDIQAAWYSLALSRVFQYSDNSVKILPFQFVVESTTYQGKPLAFTVSQEILDMGKNGREAINYTDIGRKVDKDYFYQVPISREILGYDALIDKYLYHLENGFNLEREIAEQPEEIPFTLDWQGVVKTPARIV